jgi:CrcB protein
MAMIGCMSNRLERINPVAGSALEALLVGIGAIPGAWLRLKMVNHFEPMVPKKHWGTFAVNVIACFGLGLVLALYQSCSAKTGLALLIGVGFFGSLSTFSTFAVELLNELRAGRPFVSLVLALASIAAGLCAAGAGYGLGSYG